MLNGVRMNITRWFGLSLLLAFSACGNNSGGSSGGPDASAGGLSCTRPSDCTGGDSCCVSYSANFGGKAQSSCMPSCPFRNLVDGVDSTVCVSDSDCKHVRDSSDGGAVSFVCTPLDGVSVKACLPKYP
jgi:hypothetical protein